MIYLSIIAILISAASLVVAATKARRDEERAKRSDRRLDELEKKQREEDERRLRSEAPFLVAKKLWGGTKDQLERDIWRLIVTNEGRDCIFIEIIESDYRFSESYVMNGDDIAIIYQAGMFEKGHRSVLTVRFETASGHRATHKYEIAHETVFLKRTDPMPA